MKTVTSEISACKIAVKLWTVIAAKGFTKSAASLYLDLPTMQFRCPCCEFAGTTGDGFVNCKKCPMKGFWTARDTGSYDCEKNGSPYNTWAERIDTDAPAEKVADAAAAALEYWTSMREMNL